MASRKRSLTSWISLSNPRKGDQTTPSGVSAPQSAAAASVSDGQEWVSAAASVADANAQDGSSGGAASTKISKTVVGDEGIEGAFASGKKPATQGLTPAGASSAQSYLWSRAAQVGVAVALVCGPLALLAAMVVGASRPASVATAPVTHNVDSQQSMVVGDMAVRVIEDWLTSDAAIPELTGTVDRIRGAVPVSAVRLVGVAPYSAGAWSAVVAVEYAGPSVAVAGETTPTGAAPATDGAAGEDGAAVVPPGEENASTPTQAPELPQAVLVSNWSHYEVAFLTDSEDGSLYVVGQPQPVPVSKVGNPGGLPLRTINDNELEDTAKGFAQAYLLDGDTSRWVTPSADVSSAVIPGASAIKLVSLEDATSADSPKDTKVLVAQIRVTLAGEAVRTVTLPFSATSRDGRWEISAVHNTAELLGGGPLASIPAPTTTE